MEIGIFVLSIYSSVARKHGAHLIHAFLSPQLWKSGRGILFGLVRASVRPYVRSKFIKMQF